jgi:hypothetical protein
MVSGDREKAVGRIQHLFKTKKFVRPGTVAHTYKPSTWEAEAGGP